MKHVFVNGASLLLLIIFFIFEVHSFYSRGRMATTKLKMNSLAGEPQWFRRSGQVDHTISPDGKSVVRTLPLFPLDDGQCFPTGFHLQSTVIDVVVDRIRC